MSTCPSCQAELSDEALRTGQCAACGHQLADATIVDDVSQQTVDLPQQTVDLEVTQAADPPDLVSPTVTVDSRTLSPEQREGVTATWQGAGSRETNSEMTIKFDLAEADTPKTTLAVNTRVVGDRAETARENADYQLIDIIGQGGMGVVYEARQASVDRTVAVKMLKADRATLTQRDKFMAEAVVTGDLDHPNIVPIYELGTNEQGALFYSMKRVRGLPWDEEIGRKSQTENVEILMRVADAVAFAHAGGVVHRDLKPANVMLGAFGEVLVMDWGLALTMPEFRHHQTVSPTVTMGGTPAYMAPEMVTGPIDAIGPGSDIYLLGALLYEIITGGAPHGGKNVMECVHAAAENKILPTTTTGELVNIALTAMATEPADRYRDVQEFQTAIREYQAHSESTALSSRAEQELERAGQSNDYQDFARAMFGFQEALALWADNSKASAGLSKAKLAYAASALRKSDYDLGISLLESDDPAHADVLAELKQARSERDVRLQRLKNVKRVAAALVVTVFVVITVAFFSIRQARDSAIAAQAQEQVAKQQAIVARDEAVDAQSQEQVAKQQAIEARDEAVEAHALEQVARQEAIVARDQAETARDDAMQAQEQERVAKLAAEQSRDDAVVARGEAEVAREAEAYESYLAQIGLAAAKTEENAFEDAYRLLEAYGDSPLRHWEWGRLKYLSQQSIKTFAADGPIDAVAFASDAARFVTGSRDGIVRVWQTGSDEPSLSIPHEGQFIQAVAFSPDDQRVVTGSSDGIVRIFNAADAALVETLEAHTDSVLSVNFSPDGRWLLTTSHDETARLWDVGGAEPSQVIAVLRGHRRSVWSAAFSPAMNEIVTAGQDGKAILWSIDVAAADLNVTENVAFTGHGGPVLDVTFSPDGGRVASAGYDRRVLVWDPRQVQPIDLKSLVEGRPTVAPVFQSLEGHTEAVHSIRYSADGKLLLSGSDDNTVKLWDAASGALIETLRGHSGWVRSVAFAPAAATDGGGIILTGSHDQQAKLWSIAGYEEVRVLQGRVMRGHADAVLAAAFDPSGQRVVTASRDHTARVWDVASGEGVRELREGHEYLASRAIFFPDGERLLTSAIDNSVRIWDVATGTQLRAIDGSGRTAAVALSHDGRWIVTGGERSGDNAWNAKLFDAESGELVQTLQGHERQITATAFSRDGRMLLTGDEGGEARLWRRDDPEGVWIEHRRLDGHSVTIAAAVFLPDGRRVLTASADNTVGQWDTETGQELLPLVLRHPDSITSMALSPDGRRVLTTCIDRVVRLWDVDRTEPIALLDAAGGNAGALEMPVFSSVAFSPDGRRAVAAIPEDRAVHVWELPAASDGSASGTVRITSSIALDIAPVGGRLWGAIYSPDGAELLTVGGNEARLFDAETGQEMISFSPHGAVASANFSPDGRRVVTGSWDRSAKIWNVETGRSILKLAGGHTGPVNSAVFSTDAAGSQVLTASDDGTAALWDATSGERLMTFVGHEGRVRSAVFSDDGRLVLTASDDTTARVWDSQSGEELFVLAGHRAAVVCATFSRDGRRIITGSDDKTAKLWDLETQAEIQLPNPLQGHTAGVTSVAFSADGRRVITGSRDNTAKLWDSQTGREVLTLSGHSGDVTSVAFSPDGQQVLTGSRDGTAVLWLASDWQN